MEEDLEEQESRSDDPSEIEDQGEKAGGQTGKSRRAADGPEPLVEVQLGQGTSEPEPGTVGMAEGNGTGAHGQESGQLGNPQNAQHGFTESRCRSYTQGIGTCSGADHEADEHGDEDPRDMSRNDAFCQDLGGTGTFDEGGQGTAQGRDEYGPGTVQHSRIDPFIPYILVVDPVPGLEENRGETTDEQSGKGIPDESHDFREERRFTPGLSAILSKLCEKKCETVAYYDLEAQVVARTKCTFIGHFDLVTRFNEEAPRFDEEDPRYLGPAKEAMRALAEYRLPFEINTGALNRGRRSVPYPAPPLLRYLHELGGEIIINSDAHQKEKLDGAFSEAIRCAIRCGFTHTNILARDGGKPVFRQIALDRLL